jgi:drug/metabolite transporter (DMT)-like permease
VLAEVAVIVMALIWGINYSVVKYGTGLVSPLAYNAVRVFIAAVALGLVARAWGGPAPARRDAIALLALGMLGNGIYQIFFAEGIAHTRAGEAALVVGASPALMAIIGRMRGIERVTKWGAAGIVLSICGIGLVVLGRAASGTKDSSGGSLLGDLLVLGGSVCWAIYTVLLVPYTKRVNGWHIVALTMAGGALVLVVAGMPRILERDWTTVPWQAWAAILYGSAFALVFAYMLWYRGVKVLGPTRTALFGNLQPLIALLVAWITLHERPTAWQAMGCAAIVVGVLLTRIAATEAT